MQITRKPRGARGCVASMYALLGSVQIQSATSWQRPCLFVPGVAVECAGPGELAQLVADHVLGDKHRRKLAAVVDRKGEADGVGSDGGKVGGGLDDLLALLGCCGDDVLLSCESLRRFAREV